MIAGAKPFRVASRNMIVKRRGIPAGIFFIIRGSVAVMAEYIVVLNENVGIESATSILKRYEVKVIRDLKKSRYLTGLKKDPGIEQLRKDVENSGLIKQIQPNFTYTIQN